jgi:hypothetical protein
VRGQALKTLGSCALYITLSERRHEAAMPQDCED